MHHYRCAPPGSGARSHRALTAARHLRLRGTAANAYRGPMTAPKRDAAVVSRAMTPQHRLCPCLMGRRTTCAAFWSEVGGSQCALGIIALRLWRTPPEPGAHGRMPVVFPRWTAPDTRGRASSRKPGEQAYELVLGDPGHTTDRCGRCGTSNRCGRCGTSRGPSVRIEPRCGQDAVPLAAGSAVARVGVLGGDRRVPRVHGHLHPQGARHLGSSNALVIQG